MKDPPKYEAPPPDPMYAKLKEQAQTDQINATQTQVRGDSASLMARYGSLAGAAGIPALSLAAPSTSNPSTLPIAMAMSLMSGGQTGSPLTQIARSVGAKLAA